jgi:N-acetylneuraminic acid mutarotase
VLLSTFELAENVEWMERSSVKFPPRYEHGSLLCSSRGLLYVFGGARTEGPLGDLWKYDIDKDEWLGVVPGGCAVSPRTIHSPGTHKHLLFVFGGGESGDRPVDAPGPYVFNSEIEEWFKPEISGSGPCPRQGHICACIGGKLFVHGGMAGMTFFNDLHVLDLDSWKWENPKAVGDIPSPRAAHGCAVFDSRICIFGGISLEGSLNDLHLLNTGCV